MKLIIGGAYNGKLNYVKETLRVVDEDICYIQDTLDLSKSVLYGIHHFIYHNALNGISSLPFFEEHLYDLKTKVIVCDEISSGIVPLKKEERFYREEVGRILQFLSRESNSIIRIFCGIGVVLKDE
ncbi:bifunctional adenosylcobinamide kinase/adenosylcobinamide-phosphate guanylyltransferase [Turicibacter sanguinis]|uniref:bifunctional adenosylcobinamide kinase/adenosylcobinamide-phosphate guanylyltransferase n=1 Tax=Turicibacter sanguinis TaxID=154288 RepID=UPI00241D55A4|nr:bifunctional adenosylcobinamide kinase/adenosylcobinamide-phosphate guanylyltransferase [Turicibacter sanguinis]